MTDKLIEQLRDEDSYYRVQEKHWCIDAEELERQRQAAANRIEAQAAEIERLKAEVKNAWCDDVLPCRQLMDAKQEIERLREALGWFINDKRFVVQVGGNPNVVPQMIAAARVALGETE